ncbi:MAG: MBL fold metallo-hydrolase [Paludibacteraceae bacterium]|nr:MBL fold metallo-hydrolase [Paludibacteraceae bacterium]MBP5664528.1 MBL fold metallo-hydrolase [Bacteroidales bacterium]
MLKIERFVNQLMTSNCYVVVDEESKHCLCIDPASEQSEREIAYIGQNGLTLDHIILTHEHTDHTWGVNALKGRFAEAKVICSEVCCENLAKEFQAYFLLYFDNPDYQYTVCQVDETTEAMGGSLLWQGHKIKFVSTPGHSLGSISIDIDGRLFTGDSIMQSKPYVNKRNGSKELFFESVKKILETYPQETLVYPGHGEVFQLKDYQR